MVDQAYLDRSQEENKAYEERQRKKKIMQQEIVRNELDTLMKIKKERKMQNQFMMSNHEFAMNRNSLKELGLANYADQYDDDATSYLRS